MGSKVTKACYNGTHFVTENIENVTNVPPLLPLWNKTEMGRGFF